ncbi:uncharacterized protein [Haliotis cracherodii]|uniref:uncharacterized protein isoform X1 n=1 Tax=Haliotis cracherodii TaxID=6455 RepID=UPI0039E8D8AF
MAQVADIQQVVVPQLSIDQDVLAVIDKTNRSLKLVGMADTINVLKETLNNLREMLDTSHKKNQEKQRSPRISTSILRGNRPRETSAQKQASLYQSMTSVPKEENQAPISHLLDNATSIQRDKKTQGTLTQEQPSLHPNVDDVLKKEESATRDAIEVDEATLRYLCLHKRDEVQRIEKEEMVTIPDSECGYEVKGHAVAVMWATVRLRDLVDKVKCSTFSFETGVDVRKFAETVVTVGKKHNCLIGYKPNVKTVDSRPRAQSAVPFTQENQGLKVTVVFNRIEKQNADVIVNTTNRQLNLSSGFGVSYSLLKAAGSDIETCLRHTYPNGIDHGDLAVGRSGNLETCKKIYHGCLPFYKGFKDTAPPLKCYELLVSLVFRCLIQACKDGFQTIALPAFGTGALQYPTKNVVQLMYHAIDLFTQDNRQKSLKEIFIVIGLESRQDVKQLFLAHRITHKLKTTWLDATPEDRRGFFYNLFRSRRNSNLPGFLEREVRKPVGTKCELRVMIADTLVQIINGNIRDVSNATQTALLVLSEDTESYLLKTNCDVGTSTTEPGRIIRIYGDSEAGMAEALATGLRVATEKKWYHVVIPLPPEGSSSPEETAAVIVAAIKRHTCVLTIAVPNMKCYIDIATRIARHGRVQKPPDVFPVERFNRQRSDSFGATLTTALDVGMVVTSDSEETNRNAARDVEKELHVKLNIV